MAAGKEIRCKIKSVENTRKITKAMEMNVAASKMSKDAEVQRRARRPRRTPSWCGASPPISRTRTPRIQASVP